MREALHVRVQVAMIGRWGGGAKECGGRWQQMKAMSRGRRRVPSQSQHSLRQNTSICINIAIVSHRRAVLRPQFLVVREAHALGPVAAAQPGVLHAPGHRPHVPLAAVKRRHPRLPRHLGDGELGARRRVRVRRPDAHAVRGEATSANSNHMLPSPSTAVIRLSELGPPPASGRLDGRDLLFDRERGHPLSLAQRVWPLCQRAQSSCPGPRSEHSCPRWSRRPSSASILVSRPYLCAG